MPQFTGLLCETKICDSVANCSGRGVCDSSFDSAKAVGSNNNICSCSKGYKGFYCENDINECEVEGGNETCGQFPCLDKVGRYECDYCFESKCKNGATCVPVHANSTTNVTCQCPVGFRGSVCDIKECINSKDDCNDHGICNPFRNYSQPISSENSFCLCSGYTGGHCEIFIDFCEFLGNAVCDAINENCSAELGHFVCGKPCESNPCVNGGTCSSKRSAVGFDCTCLHGFTGTLCEDTIIANTTVLPVVSTMSLSRMQTAVISSQAATVSNTVFYSPMPTLLVTESVSPDKVPASFSSSYLSESSVPVVLSPSALPLTAASSFVATTDMQTIAFSSLEASLTASVPSTKSALVSSSVKHVEASITPTVLIFGKNNLPVAPSATVTVAGTESASDVASVLFSGTPLKSLFSTSRLAALSVSTLSASVPSVVTFASSVAQPLSTSTSTSIISAFSMLSSTSVTSSSTVGTLTSTSGTLTSFSATLSATSAALTSTSAALTSTLTTSTSTLVVSARSIASSNLAPGAALVASTSVTSTSVTSASATSIPAVAQSLSPVLTRVVVTAAVSGVTAPSLVIISSGNSSTPPSSPVVLLRTSGSSAAALLVLQSRNVMGSSHVDMIDTTVASSRIMLISSTQTLRVIQSVDVDTPAPLTDDGVIVDIVVGCVVVILIIIIIICFITTSSHSKEGKYSPSQQEMKDSVRLELGNMLPLPERKRLI